jgi:glycosyltransferase involved in cell wall biosynthesis
LALPGCAVSGSYRGAMIVDHFNTLLAGGAASAARRIHLSLRRLGIDSRFWHAKETELAEESLHHIEWARGDMDAVRRVVSRCFEIGRKLQLKNDLRRHLSGHPPELEYFSIPITHRPTRFDVSARGTDVVHMHWTAKLIDYPTFFEAIPDGFPIVWTLHDMNPMTGGCHYTVGCENFTHGCGSCPLLGLRGERDLSFRSFGVKRDALAGKNLHIVGPSRWLTREAQRSPIFADARSFHTIPYGIDTDLFAPVDRQLARQTLGIPEDAVVVAFGAVDLDNMRKGRRQLFEALARLPDQSRVLGLLFGSGEPPPTDLPLPAIHAVGYVNDPKRQAMVYSAADMFVIPSLQEGFGLTGLEALSCGTPVVGFDTGGIPDFVVDGKTGLLARVGDSTDLAEKINILIDDPAARRRMGARGREFVLDNFRQQRQAEQYVRLYDEVVAAGRQNRVA